MNKTKKPTIHEAIERAHFSDNVELIDVPKQGNTMVLMRCKEMSEFAFVMWVDRVTSTRSQVLFTRQDLKAKNADVTQLFVLVVLQRLVECLFPRWVKS